MLHITNSELPSEETRSSTGSELRRRLTSGVDMNASGGALNTGTHVDVCATIRRTRAMPSMALYRAGMETSHPLSPRTRGVIPHVLIHAYVRLSPS